MVCYVAVPVTLLILPADYFDSGESLCLSVRLFGMECYACGMTRAVMHLIHLDINSAAYYNVLSFLVLPLGAGLWAYWAYREWKKWATLA